MMNKTLLTLSLLVLVCLSTSAQGLRTGVCTVYPEFDRADSIVMTDFARELVRVGFTSDAQMLRAYTNQSFGSGVLTDRCVLTNRHVVGYAKTVKLVFELRDRTLTFEHCRVLSTGTDDDIAAIELPASTDGLHALPLSAQPVQDGEDIYAAGFPGLGSEASWQLTRGSISNTHLHMGADTYIQHTAPIDPGSSGGPLLRKVDGKFEIVGLNTMKAFGRDRVGMAISTEQIQQFLQSPDNPADRQLLDAYHDIDVEHWHEYYVMLPDSMKKVLHDLDMHLPMDRVVAVVNYFGGPEAIQQKVTSKKPGKQKYDKRLDENKVGWTEPDHNALIYASYDYFLGKSQRHMVSLSAAFTNRWGIIGGVLGYGTFPATHTYLVPVEKDYVQQTDTFHSHEIYTGIEMGVNFPIRVATKHYIVPRATVSGLVGLNIPGTDFITYLPVRAGLDYHYELESVDLIFGVGYTLLIDWRQRKSGTWLDHALQFRLGFSF